jgi:tetratricopeptide (TPR) repeat protein
MKQRYGFLPRRFKREEVALAPIGWIRTLSDYSGFRKRALREHKPGFNTLIAILSTAIVRQDKNLVDVAVELTKENVPRHVYLSLAGATLCDLGSKDEGLAMLRDAVKAKSSDASLSGLAAETTDLGEKEHLSKRVLNENPEDCDALRHLAYAKYFKDEIEEAEHLLNKVLQIDAGNIYALECKGNIHFDKEEYQKALEQYLQVKLKPTPISLQLKICHCYYLLGMVNKAKRIAKKIEDKISRAYDLDGGVQAAQKLLTEILNS